MYKDVEFLEKLNVSNLDISYIKRTFCDDEMCEYLYKLIKENNFDTKQLQALCGNFEHCIPKDGDGLLELFDFIKTDKNAALQNKAYAFYDKKYKTLRQKAIDYFVEKTPDFVNAFAQEFVAYIFSRTIDGCINSQFQTFYAYVLYVGNLLSDENIYQSCFRNALNSLYSASKSEEKITLLKCFSDFATGIDYTYLLSDKPDNIRRAVVEGFYNVVKNLLARKFNLQNFFYGLGYQIDMDFGSLTIERVLEYIDFLYKEQQTN